MTGEHGVPIDPAGLALAPGALLADRFEIVRCVGRGGVGEVYEARDRELGVALALKLLRPAVAAEEGTAERFRREVLLARRVTHANVCRIFDVFHHRAPLPAAEGAGRDLTFLTMELLAGETLAERLQRTGRLQPEEALPMVAQMALGLGAAHRAGVVHRDFKSGNVILVAEAQGPPRTVITDFGLARAVDTGEGVPLTGTGAMIGTFAYMAPEQVEGEAAGAAADVYALGVVMYEMVAGRRPFAGDSPLATAVKRLKEPPCPPSRYAPGLDARWEAAILRCLERDPARRFARAEDVLEALGPVPAAALRARPRPESRRRRAFAAAVALCLAVAVCSGSHQVRNTSGFGPAATLADPLPVVSAVRPRLSVALLGFKNLSGQADRGWLSVALSEMLSTELAAGGHIRVVPGESVARLKMDLALGEADALEGETLDRIRGNLGSDRVVLGSYLAVGAWPGDKIRLNLRVQDAASGETTASLVETGTEAELLELVSRAAARLSDSLGVQEASGAGALRAAAPSNGRALRLYAEGLRRLRALDLRGALAALEQAVADDPAHALSHAALAEAWRGLGYEAKARDAARRAFELSSALAPQERLWIKARHHEAASEWDEAIQIYRALSRSSPDVLEYGLQLVAAHTAAGRQKEALPLLEGFRRLPEAAGRDPRIDLAEAEAAGALSDFTRMRRAAAGAAAKGQALGARLLVARAYCHEAWAEMNLGQRARARQLLTDARRLYEEVGDRAGEAQAMRVTGLVLWSGGDSEAAKEMFHRAHAVFSEVGNRRGMATSLDNLAMVLLKQGDIGRASEVRKQALEMFRATGNKTSIGVALTNLGNIRLKAGDLAEAGRLYEESLALHREVGNAVATGIALAQVGEVRRQQGDLAAARRAYEEALAVQQALGQEGRVAQTLRGLAEVALAAGELDEARRRADAALAVRESLGESLLAAESRLLLSRIALEEGKVDPAKELARLAADEFARRGAIDDQAIAHCVLARALLTQRHPMRASLAAAQAAELSRRSQSELTRMEVQATEARVRAESGQRAERSQALATLEGVLARARRAGLRLMEMEAMLALGEIGLSGGDAGAARSRLRQLEDEARRRGFELIARRARRAAEAGRRG